jgi:hypothetical protein
MEHSSVEKQEIEQLKEIRDMRKSESDEYAERLRKVKG